MTKQISMQLKCKFVPLLKFMLASRRVKRVVVRTPKDMLRKPSLQNCLSFSFCAVKSTGGCQNACEKYKKKGENSIKTGRIDKQLGKRYFDKKGLGYTLLWRVHNVVEGTHCCGGSTHCCGSFRKKFTLYSGKFFFGFFLQFFFRNSFYFIFLNNNLLISCQN